MNKVEVLKEAAQEILNGKMENAKELIQAEYPFKKLINTGRNYTDKRKMEECHNAYWEFVPTVDHIYPVALGGADSEENWVTTSMLHNSIKSNWTLEQLRWELKGAGNYEEWDGLTTLFVELVEADSSLLEDAYIKKWYNLSKM